MKPFGSSDSLSALVQTSSSKDSTRKTNQVYSREFQAMLDSLEEDDYNEEVGHVTEKKRRLTIEQVKALERNFETENKLEPERKLKLAEDLGLQPRQIAIWFQNRRARWKTKQLEREYVALKASFEALKHKFSSLEHEKGALTLQLEELKSKLKEENSDSSESVKEEQPVSESENNVSVQSQSHDFTGNINSDEVITDNNYLSASQEYMNWIQLSDSRAILGNGYQVYQQQFPVKLEEQNLFSTEETCNFFAVDQPPTLQCWYFPEQ